FFLEYLDSYPDSPAFICGAKSIPPPRRGFFPPADAIPRHASGMSLPKICGQWTPPLPNTAANRPMRADAADFFAISQRPVAASTSEYRR
ncbi:MAG: hypothetical protein Q4F18_00130, partial [Clostridia bacterium]|nr:hypothetical protein [Clostridia bacterium]